MKLISPLTIPFVIPREQRFGLDELVERRPGTTRPTLVLGCVMLVVVIPSLYVLLVQGRVVIAGWVDMLTITIVALFPLILITVSLRDWFVPRRVSFDPARNRIHVTRFNRFLGFDRPISEWRLLIQPVRLHPSRRVPFPPIDAWAVTLVANKFRICIACDFDQERTRKGIALMPMWVQTLPLEHGPAVDWYGILRVRDTLTR